MSLRAMQSERQSSTQLLQQQVIQLTQANQLLTQQVQQLSDKLATVSNSDVILEQLATKEQQLQQREQELERLKKDLEDREAQLVAKEAQLEQLRQDVAADREAMTTAANQRLAEIDARRADYDQRAASLDATIASAVDKRTADLQQRTVTAEDRAAKAVETAKQQARQELQDLTDAARRDYDRAQTALVGARRQQAAAYQKGIDDANTAIRETKEATDKALADARKQQANAYKTGMEQADKQNLYRDFALLMYTALIAMVYIGLTDYYKYDLRAVIKWIGGSIIQSNLWMYRCIDALLLPILTQTTIRRILATITYLGLIGCAMSLLARRIGAVIDKVYIIAHDNRLTIGILLPVLVITSELAAPYLSINSLWLHIPVIATALWIRHKLLSR